MTDVKVMSVTFLLPAGRSRDHDRFSHGSDVPYDYVSQCPSSCHHDKLHMQSIAGAYKFLLLPQSRKSTVGICHEFASESHFR